MPPKGAKMSEEHRERIREAARKRKHSDETKQKIGAGVHERSARKAFFKWAEKQPVLIMHAGGRTLGRLRVTPEQPED
jgi:protein required for attachment to host cells